MLLQNNLFLYVRAHVFHRVSKYENRKRHEVEIKIKRIEEVIRFKIDNKTKLKISRIIYLAVRIIAIVSKRFYFESHYCFVYILKFVLF